MKMNITQNDGSIPLTVLHMEGSLDGSNYEQLIAEANQLHKTGISNLVLDLSKLAFISSAGLSALHRVALIFNGKKIEELEEGWSAFRAMERNRNDSPQQHVKLLNPTKEVGTTLEMVGFNNFFEIYADIHEVVASFQ